MSKVFLNKMVNKNGGSNMNSCNCCKEEDVVIVAPVYEGAQSEGVPSMPKDGCRRVRLVGAYAHINKYGVTKAHLEFNYKGYVFGQNFKLNDSVFKKLFPRGVTNNDIGKEMFVEIEVKVGSLTGKEYPEIVGIEEE